ncbi:MAG: ABC transporter ATP-binding protein [Magnetospiraceae bacterium]
MIEIENLDFEYDDYRALTDLTAHVPEGSVTALVGPNGAGKTTLIRCVVALTRPAQGRVTVAGIDVHDAPRASHRLMGYLPDFFGVYTDLTVSQCLHHRAATQEVTGKAAAEAVAWAADRLGIADRMGQKAGTLSRGLRQRLAIAQTIVHKPKVLFLDEPASGLDPEARIELGGLIRELGETGMTVVVSSHILAELADYSTHMMILRDGRLVEFGPVDVSAVSGGPVDLELVLSGPAADHAATVTTLVPDATEISASGAILRFTLPAEVAASPDLLKSLVGADLPVVYLAPKRRDLQDSYLRSLKNQGGAA